MAPGRSDRPLTFLGIAGSLRRASFNRGLIRALECFDACSRGWSGYITDSLPNLITAGRGRPGEY